MRNGRFFIRRYGLRTVPRKQLFLSICFVMPCLFITFATLINKRKTQ